MSGTAHPIDRFVRFRGARLLLAVLAAATAGALAVGTVPPAGAAPALKAAHHTVAHPKHPRHQHSPHHAAKARHGAHGKHGNGHAAAEHGSGKAAAKHANGHARINHANGHAASKHAKATGKRAQALAANALLFTASTAAVITTHGKAHSAPHPGRAAHKHTHPANRGNGNGSGHRGAANSHGHGAGRHLAGGAVTPAIAVPPTAEPAAAGLAAIAAGSQAPAVSGHRSAHATPATKPQHRSTPPRQHPGNPPIALPPPIGGIGNQIYKITGNRLISEAAAWTFGALLAVAVAMIAIALATGRRRTKRSASI